MSSNWIILKFGGSSVGEVSHWQTIAEQAKRHQDDGLQPLLVLSALKNVSNLLEALLHQALAGVHNLAISHLKELHLGFAAKLEIEILEQITPIFSDLQNDCDAIYQNQKIPPNLHARILASGELLSTIIGAEYLNQYGINTHWQDVRQILTSNNHTDEWHHFTSARCSYAYRSSVSNMLQQKSAVIVTQGFIAADEKSQTVLLGREGSDTTAAYLGAILAARRVEIWTDVTGVFSSNPREIAGTQQLPELSYRQANQMARFGAKVLHPRAVQPAMENNIPICVKCTGTPQHPGTTISSQDINYTQQNPVAAVVYEQQVTKISLLDKQYSEVNAQIKAYLCELGFDQLLTGEQNDSQELLMLYTNSDKPQPSDQKLRKKILSKIADPEIFKVKDNKSDLTFKLQSDCALISVIGSKTQTAWVQQCIELIENQFTTELLAHYPAVNEGRYSFLTRSENCLLISQTFHKALINSQ
ncbi:aspartate kinase [Aliikangiella coralliicola]|uniref:Aspartokinase n=1 Tax=Aliikangiella coralliicola TaxID=2592383 RepID=A0A545UBJ3_9GAMM|nr:aspartate kinase [Aliikangiella coralliicola]TQV86840.1 aspartate kinase [Aliikangiella coralliicola]